MFCSESTNIKVSFLSFSFATSMINQIQDTSLSHALFANKGNLSFSFVTSMIDKTQDTSFSHALSVSKGNLSFSFVTPMIDKDNLSFVAPMIVMIQACHIPFLFTKVIQASALSLT